MKDKKTLSQLDYEALQPQVKKEEEEETTNHSHPKPTIDVISLTTNSPKLTLDVPPLINSLKLTIDVTSLTDSPEEDVTSPL
jgi:hypothetical protein